MVLNRVFGFNEILIVADVLKYLADEIDTLTVIMVVGIKVMSFRSVRRRKRMHLWVMKVQKVCNGPIYQV